MYPREVFAPLEIAERAEPDGGHALGDEEDAVDDAEVEGVDVGAVDGGDSGFFSLFHNISS